MTRAGQTPRLIALGASAGGLKALTALLGSLPGDFPLPLVLVQHLHPEDDGRLAAHLDTLTPLRVVTPCDKEPLLPGHVYVAPANYHMLVERHGGIALTVDEKICHSRPSIDVLFDSAAHAFGPGLIAVLLTGANSDGAQGMRAVRELGGWGIAQDPEEAEYPIMPQAAIRAAGLQTVLPLQAIARALAAVGAGPDQ